MIECRIQDCDNPADVNKEGRKGLRCRSCEYLQLKYGISTPERDRMLSEQDNRCRLCLHPIAFSTNTGGSSRSVAAVDHSDKPFRIRGILCSGCNTALGRLGDTPEMIRRALKYVEE